MKRKEQKAEVGGKGEEKVAEADRKPAAKTISQIPKKTSPKKPLVPVKEEPSNLTKDARRGNCKYNCKCENFIIVSMPPAIHSLQCRANFYLPPNLLSSSSYCFSQNLIARL